MGISQQPEITGAYQVLEQGGKSYKMNDGLKRLTCFDRENRKTVNVVQTPSKTKQLRTRCTLQVFQNLAASAHLKKAKAARQAQEEGRQWSQSRLYKE